MGPNGQYAYLNARIRAKMSLRLSEEALEELIHAGSVSEATARLKSGIFSRMSEAYERTGDLGAAEAAAMLDRRETLVKLVGGLSTSVRAFVVALVASDEIENVKATIRLWFNRVSLKRPVALGGDYCLRIEGGVYDVDYDAAFNATDVETLARAFAKTPFAATIIAHAQSFRDDGSVFKVESAIDKYYYQKLNAAARALGGSGLLMVRRLIGARIDLENIICQARYASYGIKREEARGYFIPGGRRLGSKEDYAKLAENDADLIARIKEWYPELQSLTGSVLDVAEAARAKQASIDGRVAASCSPFSPAPIVAYDYLLKEDLRRVTTVLQGLHYGMSEAEIRGLL